MEGWGPPWTPVQTPVLSTGGGASQECPIPSLPGPECCGAVTCPHRWGQANLSSLLPDAECCGAVTCPHRSARSHHFRSRVLQFGHLSSQMGMGTNLSPSLPGPERCGVVTRSSPPPQPHMSLHKSSPVGRRPLAPPCCSGEGSQDSDLTSQTMEHAQSMHMAHVYLIW